MTNNSTLWYISQLFHMEEGRWGDLNLLSSSSSSSGWYTCSGAFVLVQGASEVDWETSFRGVFSYRPLAPWKMLSFRPNRGFPRSKNCLAAAESSWMHSTVCRWGWRKRDNWVPRAERSVDFSLGEGTLRSLLLLYSSTKFQILGDPYRLGLNAKHLRQ